MICRYRCNAANLSFYFSLSYMNLSLNCLFKLTPSLHQTAFSQNGVTFILFKDVKVHLIYKTMQFC